MRAFTVAVATAFLADLAPTITMATNNEQEMAVRIVSKDEEKAVRIPSNDDMTRASNEVGVLFHVPPAFDFETATMGQKVRYLSATGQAQAAIEVYHAMPRYPEKVDSKVIEAYAQAMMAFVPLEGVDKGSWPHVHENHSVAMKVRALWGDNALEDVITLYERNALACNGDPRATAAYLNAKLRMKYPALPYPKVHLAP